MVKNKAVVFDLDGTLLDTVDTISYHLNRALSECGFDTVNREKTRAFVGNGPRRLIERALGEKLTQESYDAVFGIYDKSYNASPSYLTKPYSGIVDLVLNLKKEGYLIGIISNKQEKIVQKTVKEVFGDLFDSVLGQVDNIPVKPDPKAMARVFDSLGVAPSMTVYVGDSEVDIISGHNIGAKKTIGVTWGFRSKDTLVDAGAEYIADSADELYKMIIE
jgi:phosphoglycolate phosphatase